MTLVPVMRPLPPQFWRTGVYIIPFLPAPHPPSSGSQNRDGVLEVEASTHSSRWGQADHSPPGSTGVACHHSAPSFGGVAYSHLPLVRGRCPLPTPVGLVPPGIRARPSTGPVNLSQSCVGQGFHRGLVPQVDDRRPLPTRLLDPCIHSWISNRQ